MLLNFKKMFFSTIPYPHNLHPHSPKGTPKHLKYFMNTLTLLVGNLTSFDMSLALIHKCHFQMLLEIEKCELLTI